MSNSILPTQLPHTFSYIVAIIIISTIILNHAIFSFFFFFCQSELDTLAATLKQLENQKGEAQKRLNDLRAQVIKYAITN
jgi:uncharacterized membrane protein YciS (DUF1049 family)